MRKHKRPLALLLILSLTVSLFVGLTLVSSAATPVIWLKFDGDLNDASGNGRSAVYKDGTPITYVDGNRSKAAMFDHTLLEIQNSVGIDFSKGISYSAWLKLEPDVTSGNYLAMPWGNEYTFRADIGWANTGASTELYNYSKDYPNDSSNAIYELATSNTGLTAEHHTDKYMHVVFAFDGTTYRYWIDGKLDNSGTLVNADHYGNGILLPNDANMILGGFNGTWHAGALDDLRIYNTGLTSAEALALYNENSVAKGSNTMIVTLAEPNMMVNGVLTEIDPGRGTVAESISGRTRVPISNFMKIWGAAPVGWDGKTGKVTLVYKGITVQLWIGKNTAMVNGKSVQIDERDPTVVPMIKNGRTMLPLSFVMKQFSIAYKWVPETSQIHIYY